MGRSTSPPGARPRWVIDGSLWPRPEAKTSPARTWGRFVTTGPPESGIIGTWEDQILAAIPAPAGSGVLPGDRRRRDLAAGPPTRLAVAQPRAALATWPPATPRPLVVLDSHYDVVEVIRAELGVALLARLACHRRFYRPPPPYAGSGRPCKHGPVCRLKDPATHGAPAHTQSWADPDYGRVTIDGWARRHPPPAPAVDLTVIRGAVAPRPRHGRTCGQGGHAGPAPSAARQVPGAAAWPVSGSRPALAGLPPRTASARGRPLMPRSPPPLRAPPEPLTLPGTDQFVQTQVRVLSGQRRLLQRRVLRRRGRQEVLPWPDDPRRQVPRLLQRRRSFLLFR